MSRTESTQRGAVRGTSARGADGAAPADAALADRFRRVLGAPRRDAASRAPQEPSLATPDLPARVPGTLDDEGQASARDSAERKAPETSEAPEPPIPNPPPPAATPTLAQPPAPWVPTGQGQREGGGQDGGAQRDHEAHAIETAQVPAWLEDTADFVGSLCAGVDATFQTWRMNVPLDAQQLPETQLELSLSPHTLCLRFRSGSPESARLVLQYRQQLLDLLSQVPALPSHIDIELD